MGHIITYYIFVSPVMDRLLSSNLDSRCILLGVAFIRQFSWCLWCHHYVVRWLWQTFAFLVINWLQSSNLDYMYISWKVGHRALFASFSDVINMWSLDLDKFQYFQLWIGYRLGIGTVRASGGQEFIGYFSSVGGDVFIMWWYGFEKLSSLQLWMGYSHQF